MLRSFFRQSRRSLRCRRGVTASEYAILAIALVAIIAAWGQTLGNYYNSTVNVVTVCASGGGCGTR